MKYQPYLIVFTDGKLNCTAPRDRVGRSLCTAFWFVCGERESKEM